MKDKKTGNSIFKFEREAGIDSAFGDWRSRMREKQEKQTKNKEESIYDFLPIVKINKSEYAKNAIISIKECKTHKKTTISLGSDNDTDKQNYLIVDIVIAQNSVAKIPLIVKKGYDPWGFQDGDGVLSFKSSNSNIELNFIDNDDTDYKDNEDKYDLKDAEYGDELVMEISTKRKNNRSLVARNISFIITVYASDDKSDSFSSKSKRTGICGQFNVKVVEKDVFMMEEKHLFLKENQNSLDNHTECFIAVDNQFSKVVDNKNLRLDNYTDLTGIDRANDYSKKGYVYSSKRFNQESTWIRVDKENYEVVPTSFRSGKETVFSDYIISSISKKIGFHIYYFILLNAYHVLSIVVDNRDPCDIKFKILDQLQDRAWRDLKKLDTDILDMTIRNYVGACKSIKNINHDSSVQLWKLQRK